jgi:hypothetical protein
VSVDNDSVETESFQPFAVDLHVVLERGWLRLAQTINVENCTQIVKAVVASKVQSLPNGSLSTFTITNQTVGPVKQK